jgi:proline iminopeptidase
MKIFLGIIIFLSCISLRAATSTSYRYFDSNGLKIAYREFGTGIPLVVLNGGPGRSSVSFTDLALKLSQKYHVILFDQRGTGHSKLPALNETTITLDLMIGDLEALRKFLKYEKINILGHSFGGMYAMAYAAQYPYNVNALILSASGGVDLSWHDYVSHNMLSRLNQKSRQKYEYWTNPKVEKKNPVRADQEATRLLASAYVYNQKFAEEIATSLTDLKLYTPAINNLVWKSMEKFDLKGSFKNFLAPTLILAGRQDILGEAVPITIHNEIINSRLEFIDECSHYPWLDRPDAYFRLIDDFLSTVGRI